MHMTPIYTPILHPFRPNDDVRLLSQHGEVRSGALGRILGRYSRTNPTYLVSFQNVPGCVEVRADEIALR
jgi:hypothetical protein